jgi:hypothetical protein
MEPAEKTRVKAAIYWNAGRTTKGGRGFDNFLIGASWSHWGSWPERQTHIYLGLWTLTIYTPTSKVRVREDLLL